MISVCSYASLDMWSVLMSRFLLACKVIVLGFLFVVRYCVSLSGKPVLNSGMAT